MDAALRSLWEAIALGYRPNPADGFDFEHNLLGAATEEEVRWILRVFGDAEDELVDRWTRFRAHFSAPLADDESLLEQASRWVAEVGRSAAELGFANLATVCQAGCELTDEPEPRPDPNTLWEYDKWVAEINSAVHERPLLPGVSELSEAYWGATHQFEMRWYLLGPLVPQLVDTELYLAVAEHGGLCQISDTRATVSRF